MSIDWKKCPLEVLQMIRDHKEKLETDKHKQDCGNDISYYSHQRCPDFVWECPKVLCPTVTELTFPIIFKFCQVCKDLLCPTNDDMVNRNWCPCCWASFILYENYLHERML
jgi:hypothetical protein